MAQTELTCSLRGCGQPLILTTKKRNRDRRPTYTCTKGHHRKTCNDCGKQGEAKNFSRHVCKSVKGQQRLAHTRQPRRTRKAVGRGGRRARARLPSDDASVGSQTSSVATFSSDSEDGGSVGRVTSHRGGGGGGGGGSGGLGSATIIRGGGTGGSGYVACDDALHTIAEDDIDPSLEGLETLPPGALDGHGDLLDDTHWTLPVPGAEAFGDLALWDDGVGSAAADLLLDDASQGQGGGLDSPQVAGATTPGDLDALLADAAATPANALEVDEFLGVALDDLSDDLGCDVAMLHNKPGQQTAADAMLDAAIVATLAEVPLDDDEATLGMLESDALLPSSRRGGISAGMPGRRVRARIAAPSEYDEIDAISAGGGGGKHPLALPVPPPTVTANEHQAAAAAAVAAAVTVATASTVPVQSPCVVEEVKPLTSVVHHRGAASQQADDVRLPVMPVNLTSPTTVPGMPPRGDSIGSFGVPDNAKLNGFDWIRGRVSVFMGMFFLFYAVTFVLEAGIFGIEGLNNESQSQSAPNAPADPAMLRQDQPNMDLEFGAGLSAAGTQNGVLEDVVMTRSSPLSEVEDEVMDGGAGIATGAAFDSKESLKDEMASGSPPPPGAVPQPASEGGMPGTPAQPPIMEDSADVDADTRTKVLHRAAPMSDGATARSGGGGGGGGGGAIHAPTSAAMSGESASAQAATSSIGVVAALAVSAVVALALSGLTVVIYRNRQTLFRRCRRGQSDLLPRYYDGGRLPMVRAI